MRDENGNPLEPDHLDWRIASFLYRERKALENTLCPTCDNSWSKIERECYVCGSKWRYGEGGRKEATMSSLGGLSNMGLSARGVSLRSQSTEEGQEASKRRAKFFGKPQ